MKTNNSKIQRLINSYIPPSSLTGEISQTNLVPALAGGLLVAFITVFFLSFIFWWISSPMLYLSLPYCILSLINLQVLRTKNVAKFFMWQMGFLIIGLQSAGTYYYGWDVGFQYYLFCIIGYIFLDSHKKYALPIVMFTLSFVSFIVSYYYLQYLAPQHLPLEKNIFQIIHTWNILIPLIAVSFISYLFNRTTYLSQVELRSKHQELLTSQKQLVEAEKLAAIGLLSKEMAHEIQNPLNFVNNLSEINAELAQELHMQIDKFNLNEDSKEDLGMLITNSVVIQKHGERVATIVNKLQEQVRKNEVNL